MPAAPLRQALHPARAMPQHAGMPSPARSTPPAVPAPAGPTTATTPATPGPAGPDPGRVLLREPVPGDLGWVVQQHGALYAREYGWDWRFEALVAGIVADFVRQFQPGVERCWIAELGGQPVGSAFVVRKSASTAQLRLLLLRPEARGLGLGGRLTDECLAFARQAGYRDMVLWTNRSLLAARAIYARRGFQCVASAGHADFGVPDVSETWALALV